MRKCGRLLAPFLLACILSLLTCSCLNTNRFSREKTEAKRLIQFLQNSDCLGNYSYWKSVVNESRVELCFRGDGDIQRVFDTAKQANQYLDANPKSLINEQKMELEISFFLTDADQNEYNRYQYYASIIKHPQDGHSYALYVHSEDTIYTSWFLGCSVPLKEIESTYNVVFDDYDALLGVNGLEHFVLSDYYVQTNNEQFIQVLESLCYFEDNDISLPFKIEVSYKSEFESIYADFVSSHPEYQLFQ